MSSRNNRTQNDLENLRLPELQARFREVTGETSRSPNRTFLIRRITEALAARATSATTEPASSGTHEAPPAPAQAGQEGEDEQSEGDEPQGAPNATDGAQDGQEGEDEEAEEEEPQDAPSATNSTQEADTSGALEEVDSDGSEGSSPAEGGATGGADATSAGGAPRQRGRFASLSIEEIQAKYLEAVGRETNSCHKGYLIWKIREAEKGRIPIGPRQSRTADGERREMKVIPLRLDAVALAEMDIALQARGIKSRMDFLRAAIGRQLAHLGAAEAAALFTPA